MLRRIISSLVLLALATAYVAPLAAGAAPAPSKKNAPKRSSKLAPEFDAAGNASDLVRVIIQTKGRPTSAHDSAVASKGGRKGRTFEAIDAMTAVVPRAALASLAAREDVAYVSPDRAVVSEMAVTREATGAALAQAGVSNIPGLTGKGVGIAIVDRFRE